MNIVYISHLQGDIANGLAWSVPASIKAQEKIDNVLWLNTSDAFLVHWSNVLSFCKSKRLISLSHLSAPFNKPDVVIFEGFYDDIYDILLGFWLQRKNIPYVIIPRSALTYKAFHNHAYLKKRIAHTLFYDSYIKRAHALQYLTQRECEDTKKIFECNYFIVPNGIDLPQTTKEFHEGEHGIHAVFVGRIDIYQKGLDILLDAMAEIKDDLVSHQFELIIYGPVAQDYDKVVNLIKGKGLDDIIRMGGQIYKKEKALLAADLFILTSRFEGLPMGLLEALSYGLPCAITDGSNMKQEIEASNAGWTADNNKDSVKSMLLQVLAEKDKIEEKGVNARSLSQKYDWNRIALKTHEELKRLLKV